jgi:hypothetical protein
MRTYCRRLNEKICAGPLGQSVFLAVVCGRYRDSDVSPMISQIVIGIVIAWIIIQVLERLATLLERNADAKNKKPGEPSE